MQKKYTQTGVHTGFSGVINPAKGSWCGLNIGSMVEDMGTIYYM
jgi:hypothetical protein